MRYRNLKTGAIFDSPCLISGGDWVREGWVVQEEDDGKIHVRPTVDDEVIDTPVEKVEEATKETATKETEVDPDGDFNGITIAQIKQELDAFGIEYNPRAKKQELYDLMMQGR